MSEINQQKLFKEQLAQGLNVVTVNYFSGVFSAAASSPLPPKEDATVNTSDYRKQFIASPVLLWGDKNNFPADIDAEARNSSVFEGAFKVLCDHMRGQDFYLYKFVYKDGKRIVEEVELAGILDELEALGYYEYWYDACGELPKWGNLWPVFGMNSKKEIALIKTFDGAWNRLERPSPKDGNIKNIYVSAQWPNNIHPKLTSGAIPDELKNWVFRYPLLSRQRAKYVDELQYTAAKTFAAHVKFHTSGSVYGRAPWHSLYANRWLGISGKVPEMMIRYYEAAMTINYLIYINNEWIKRKFPEWEDENFDREKAIKTLQESYEKNLKGTGNAYKSLMLLFDYDSSGTERKYVKWELLDNKIREGNFIPDSQVSDSQVLFTLGVHSSLLGSVVPGGKGGEGGSGSNIREASLALQMRLTPDRDLAHTAFYIWRDYQIEVMKRTELKGIMIGVRDYVINTMDGARPPQAGTGTGIN